jgi:hypothetical protein
VGKSIKMNMTMVSAKNIEAIKYKVTRTGLFTILEATHFLSTSVDALVF